MIFLCNPYCDPGTLMNCLRQPQVIEFESSGLHISKVNVHFMHYTLALNIKLSNLSLPINFI